MNYGGNENTLVTRLGIDEETAKKAYDNFGKRYPGIAKARQRIIDMFCSMTQPGGIGTEVIWKTPADYIESLFSGAVQSALYGAAFAIQGANMRAGANHEIQSTGADITKYVQNEVWKLQPFGVYPWQVQPMNVHDEIVCPCLPELAGEVESTVLTATETFRDKIPLIKMEWNKEAKSWAK
jgi:DNA polymerase I-like protein with 3'-5' exonuclease and polymerase domains